MSLNISTNIDEGILYPYQPFSNGYMDNSGIVLESENKLENRDGYQPYYPTFIPSKIPQTPKVKYNENENIIVNVICSTIELPHKISIKFNEDTLDILSGNTEINSFDYRSLQVFQYYDLVEIYSCDVNIVISSQYGESIADRLKHFIQYASNFEDFKATRRFVYLNNYYRHYHLMNYLKMKKNFYIVL